MEEDILYGKKRHFFGGIAPSNMLNFKATYDEATSKTTIRATLPKDTIIDDQMICCVGGAVIRKKNDGYPKDEFDGEFVADITTDKTVTLTGKDAKYRYYAAFPYSKQGVYNRNVVNRSLVINIPTYTYLYGYDLNLNDPDTSTRVYYPDDVDNNGDKFTPAGMDFESGAFSYGDWPSEAGVKFMPRPCMLKYDGTRDYYLDPNDYTKKADGTASDVANTSYGGNAMMEWPKIYTKRWEENGIYHFRCSDAKIDSEYECWCNYDKNNNEINRFYTAIYQGVKSGDRLRSISGAAPTTSVSMSTFKTYAQANSTDHDIAVISDRLLITDLLVMITRTTDLQSDIGIGARTAGTIYSSGTLNAKGMFWGSNVTGNTTDPVKVFGMENWWGNKDQFLLGWCSSGGTQAFKFTRGTKDGSTVFEYNYTSSVTGYKTGILPTTVISSGANYTSGYVDECVTTKFGRIPSSINGSGSLYECDFLQLSTLSRVSTVSHVGDSGHLDGGPFQYNVGESPSSNSKIGASLSCKPSAT